PRAPRPPPPPPPPAPPAPPQALISLTVSHLLAVGLKRKFKRIRPYLALEQVNTAKTMLKDPSFPSGHTTAIFSIITPFLFMTGWFSLVLLVLAILVGMSRVYLGHHYPSDCLVGSFLGTVSALLVVMMTGWW
ncbi:phosphatase PAP2 family protein, partial [Paenibacillus larvae]